MQPPAEEMWTFQLHGRRSPVRWAASWGGGAPPSVREGRLSGGRGRSGSPRAHQRTPLHGTETFVCISKYFSLGQIPRNEVSVPKYRASVKNVLAVVTEAPSSWLIKTKQVWVKFDWLICSGRAWGQTGLPSWGGSRTQSLSPGLFSLPSLARLSPCIRPWKPLGLHPASSAICTQKRDYNFPL